MARARQQQPEQQEPPKLTAPRDDVAREVQDRIALGEGLRDREIAGESDLEDARSDYRTWSDYNAELLRRRFTNSEFADEYRSTPSFGVISLGFDSLDERIDDFRDDVKTKLQRLESVLERLPLVEETPQVRAAATPAAAASEVTTKTVESIFIVHGRNDAVKLGVHGFLREITKVESIVLHLEANEGRTVLEKFEAVGSRAGFAVILLTGDDVGRLATEPSTKDAPRARQNVVWEFGFFVGALGRSHVVVLYEPGVELPSDLHGLLYIELDAAGGWKLPLARELSAAGIAVDGDKLLSA